jgi:hypothetical protein
VYFFPFWYFVPRKSGNPENYYGRVSLQRDKTFLRMSTFQEKLKLCNKNPKPTLSLCTIIKNYFTALDLIVQFDQWAWSL